MTTLRVLLAASPLPERAGPWALFDESGACVRTGRGEPNAWPGSKRIEAVIAASQVRIASVALPPVPAASVAAAAGFALEDQLAGPPALQHLAVSTQQADGRVRVAIVARSLIAALIDMSARTRAIARIVAEPDLALPVPGWRWCADDSRRGDAFIRRADGSAMPVSAPGADGRLPPELALALAQARRDATLPVEVRVDADVADADLARWQSETGVAFVRGTPWHWHAAPPAAFAAAIDLRQGAFAPAPAAPRGARLRLFAPALLLATVALAVHVAATGGEWGWLKLEEWRQARAWATLAASAGLAADAATTSSSAQLALARRYAELRHAHGLPAPDDALPLLARAAPALRALPAGAVKSATYADSHWTLDLPRVDAATIGDLGIRMRTAGISAVIAMSAGGARVRLGGP
jgi:type II secretion system protein L